MCQESDRAHHRSELPMGYPHDYIHGTKAKTDRLGQALERDGIMMYIVHNIQSKYIYGICPSDKHSLSPNERSCRMTDRTKYTLQIFDDGVVSEVHL